MMHKIKTRASCKALLQPTFTPDHAEPKRAHPTKLKMRSNTIQRPRSLPLSPSSTVHWRTPVSLIPPSSHQAAIVGMVSRNKASHRPGGEELVGGGSIVSFHHHPWALVRAATKTRRTPPMAKTPHHLT